MRNYWLAIVAAMTLGHAGTAIAADVAGQVVSATGTAELIRDGRSQPMPPGSNFYAKDNFATGKASLLRLDLVDDSVLVLGSDTRVQLQSFSRDPETPSVTQSVLALARGSLNASTARKNGSTIMVVTQTASISISDGQAGIFYDPSEDGAGLIVRNDNARVSITYNGRAFLVPANQSIRIQPDGSVDLLPDTAPDLQNLPVLPQIDNADPLMRDAGVPELRVEPVPSFAVTRPPTPTPRPRPATPTPTITERPTPPVSRPPTPTGSTPPTQPPVSTPTPSRPPTPTLTPPPKAVTPTPVSPP